MKYQNPYAFLGSPYAQMYASPFPMKTPEQYQAELMAQVQPQMQQYRQMYDATQAQAKAEENSGIYYKVGSYDEMMKIQAPAEGKPIMVFDENAGRLYSKRFENGQTYVVGFQLTALDSQKADKKTENQENNPQNLGEILNRIDERLSALEGKNEPSADIAK